MILNGGSVPLPRRNRNLPQGNSINSMLAKAIFGCLQDAWRGGDVRALDQGDRGNSHGPSYSQPFDRLNALKHRSEEHTSELQSLMRISYAVFCLKKKRKTTTHETI